MLKNITELKIDIPAWVERAKNDPVKHFQRQAAEITLNTIALTSPLNEQLVLKGGILMGLAYGSPRQTSDIDLSAALVAEPEIDKKIAKMLDESFPKVAASLGYTDVILRTHSVKKKPKPSFFAEASFPALKMKVAYAERGTKDADSMQAGKPINSMFEIDISFNEPMKQTQILSLDGGGDLLAYDMEGLIAEKYRAMLQQVVRNRSRRQDVYDLYILINHEEIKATDPSKLLESFITKCRSRDIEPDIKSLNSTELYERSAKDWHTMELEIGDLPDFDDAFEVVRDFYRSLPW